MCFQTIKEWIELIESLVVIAAAGVAIWAALGWRRDFLSRRRLEIREDVLTKMQELKALLLQVNGGLRYIEHLEPEPEVGESTVALRLDVEEVVKEHQLVLAKFDEIKVLELKARLLFEPKEIQALRGCTGFGVHEDQPCAGSCPDVGSRSSRGRPV